MKQIIAELIAFRDARGWAVHHNPESLAYALACEAGELLRLWEWGKEPDVVRVAEEVADVAIYCLYLDYLNGRTYRRGSWALNTFELVPELKALNRYSAQLLSHQGERDWPGYILDLCDKIALAHHLDLEEIITAKIAKNGIKYPLGKDHAAANGWKGGADG